MKIRRSFQHAVHFAFLSKLKKIYCGSNYPRMIYPKFKFILLLLGDTNLKPGPATPKRNDILWEPLPFHNCSFSTERMDYQLDPLSIVSNDAWNIFQKKASLHSFEYK